MTFWQTLCQHVVFLIVLVPLFGAVLIAFTARAGPELARRTALSNACVTCALAALMLARYDPALIGRNGQVVTLQMTTALRWIGGSTSKTPAVIHLAFGVDGISLWFLAGTALLTLAALAAVPTRFDADSPAARSVPLQYALLLAAESLLLGAFAALDVVLLSTCVIACGLPVFVSCGLWGGPGRREAVRRFLVGHVAGGALVLAGLLGLVAGSWDRERAASRETEVVEPTFSLLRTIAGRSESDSITARNAARARLLPALALVAGFCLLTPLAGRHGAWLDMARESPAGVRVMLLGGVLGLGVYGMARCIGPVLAGTLAGGEWLPILVAVNALWIVLRATAAEAPMSVRGPLCHAAIACAGILAFASTSTAGSVMLVVQTSLCVALIELAQSDAGRGMGIAGDSRLVSLANAALAGLPGLCAFPGLWMIAMGVGSGTEARPGSYAAAGILVIAILASAWRRSRSVASDPDSELRPTTGWGVRALVAFLVLLIIAGGTVLPALMAQRIMPSIERMQ